MTGKADNGPRVLLAVAAGPPGFAWIRVARTTVADPVGGFGIDRVVHAKGEPAGRPFAAQASGE